MRAIVIDYYGQVTVVDDVVSVVRGEYLVFKDAEDATLDSFISSSVAKVELV